MKSDLVTAAFDQAVRDFTAELNDKALSDEISKIDSIEAVYDATDAIQKERGQRGLLRNLKKIEPFLVGLRSYAAVIEVFIQSKQDILALIWGPVKLLLQWANVLTQSMDAIINTLADIDWQLAFESVWPKQREKIDIVRKQIELHSRLLSREVTFEHIQGAVAAQKRALEHYEVDEASLRRQEYQSIKRDICPAEYGARLDFLDSHTCPGTGRWLATDTAFIAWQQNTEKSQMALWIQGIPGAGKTFLCREAIRELQALAHARTLYAFLTYRSREQASALSILHSLVFELASGDADLELLLCQSVQQSFKDSFDVTADILTMLICHAGPTYIVLDGLDEISESERQRLLAKLLKIMEACDGLRILFSSRAEADIQKLLEGQPSIRVDKCNENSIAVFVSQRTDQWLSWHSFLPEAAADLRALLKPVAIKAQGMFLYANVIFGMITELNDLDEVRAELSVLPENLDAAYARILSRINNGPIPSKNKARNLLGLIGCSPTSLTMRELEQALVISRQNAEGDGRVVAVTELVRICGPIVEIVDDYVQFVHFTAQEFAPENPVFAPTTDMSRYLFSSRVPGRISLSDATLDLACSCLTYLSQSHHDDDMSEQAMKEQVYRGAYRLHDFARTTWLQVVELYLTRNRDLPIPGVLVNAIEIFKQRRANLLFTPSKDTPERRERRNYAILVPEIRDSLLQAAEFEKICSNDAFSRAKGLDWTDYDPFTTSAFSAHLFQHLNTVLEDVSTTLEQRQLIAWHYGNRPFKCGYVACKYSRHGFASREECKKHTKEHELKWFCSVEGCSYATGGFVSRRMRDNHLEKYHTSTGPMEMPDTYRDHKELMELLYDVVAADDVTMIESLLPHFDRLEEFHKNEIRTHALRNGSIATYERIHHSLTGSLLAASLSVVGSDVFLRLLSKYKVIYGGNSLYNESSRREVLEAILRSESEEALKAWLLITELSESILLCSLPLTPSSRIIAGASRLIQATENRPTRENMIIRVWEMISPRQGPPALSSQWLPAVAQTTCSVRLAKFLLQCGIPVDYTASQISCTPLLFASQKTTEEAAGLMRFLLLHGADPEAEPEYRKRRLHQQGSDQQGQPRKKSYPKIAEGKGARNIKKWLGITWEELVAETRLERETSRKLS